MLCCPYNIVYILITVCDVEKLGITSVFMLFCPYNIVYILITLSYRDIWNYQCFHAVLSTQYSLYSDKCVIERYLELPVFSCCFVHTI